MRFASESALALGHTQDGMLLLYIHTHRPAKQIQIDDMAKHANQNRGDGWIERRSDRTEHGFTLEMPGELTHNQPGEVSDAKQLKMPNLRQILKFPPDILMKSE